MKRKRAGLLAGVPRALVMATLPVLILVSARPAHAQQDAVRATSAEAAGETWELARVDELPRVVNQVQFARSLAANYPPELRDGREGGTVLVRFRVLADGTVDSATVRVTQSSNKQFNEAAAVAVRGLRFRPARVRGRPVRVWVEQPIVFQVAEEDEEKTPAAPRNPR